METQRPFWGKINYSLAQARLGQSLLIEASPQTHHFKVALEIAKKLNCQQATAPDFIPCGECAYCRSIQTLNSPDLLLLFPAPKVLRKDESELLQKFRACFREFPYMALQDWNTYLKTERKQSIISVDEIRKLKHQMIYKSYVLPSRVVIIWYAELMNVQTANALLKLLEEPNENTYIILTSERASTLLPTVLSRCQRLRLPPFSDVEVQTFLRKHFPELPEAQQRSIAHMAEGSFSMALRIASGAYENTFLEMLKRFLGNVYRGEWKKLNDFAYELAHSSKEMQKYFLNYLLRKFRDCLLLQLQVQNVSSLTDEEKKVLIYLARQMPKEILIQIIEHLDRGIYEVQRNINFQLWLMQLGMQLHLEWRKKAKQ